MEMIRQVKPDEGEMIRAFAQTVFAAEGGPADFAQLLPKVYRSPQDSARQHLLLAEEGKIQGLLLRTVTQLSAGGRLLPVGHIGSVCVAPAYRGRGAMSRLLSCAVEDLRRDGCALIVLSGQRQRYEHAGVIPVSYTHLDVYKRQLLAHVADPEECWDKDLIPDWAFAAGYFYGDGTYVEKETLYTEVEDVLTRFPGLRIILAHCFFMSADLERLDALMQRHPNVCLDIVSGTEMYWNFGRRPDDWRAFFLKYQDRIIYGTDNMNLYDAREIENARITNDLQRGFLMSTGPVHALSLIHIYPACGGCSCRHSPYSPWSFKTADWTRRA